MRGTRVNNYSKGRVIHTLKSEIRVYRNIKNWGKKLLSLNREDVITGWISN